MSEMKLIMENWRGYVETGHLEEIFERHEYISGVLGIRLPINESGQVHLNEELKDHILQEHLLFESFLSSIINGVKKKSGQLKDLLMTLAGVFTDPRRVEIYIRLVASKVIKYPAREFRTVFNKMEEIGGAVGQFGSKILEIFESVLKKFRDMEGGWKKALVATSLGALLMFLYEKAGTMIKEALSGEISDHFLKFLRETFVEQFIPGLIDKVKEKLIDITTYLGYIGPIVGGVSFLANALAPVTSRMSDSVFGVHKFAGKPAQDQK
jgi:hypothetical protein